MMATEHTIAQGLANVKIFIFSPEILPELQLSQTSLFSSDIADGK